MPEEADSQLTGKVKRGMSWVALERLLLRGILFVRLPILSYLLTPRDFGLMSIVSTILMFLDVFTRTGFDTALVQREGRVEAYLDVGWSLSFAKGFVQAALLVLFVQPVSVFYEEPLLKQLLLVIAVSIFLKNLKSIRVVNLTRDLEMRRLTVYNLVTDILGTLTTIGLAYWLRNVWALVLGNVVTSFFKLAGSFVIAPYRPRFNFNVVKLKELWSYGRWVLLSGILLTLFRHGDDLLVGKVLGITALGYYAMAYKLGNLVTTELVDAVRKVLFPAFASLQKDTPRLRRLFLASYQLTAAGGGLFSLGLCLLAPEFVAFILGDKWLPIVPALRILAVWGGFQMLSTSLAPLFRAVGKPDWWTKVQALKVIVLGVTIYPLTIHWGIVGTSVAVLIAAALEIPLGLWWARRVLQCRWSELLSAWWGPAMAIAIATAFYLLTYRIFHLSALPHLLVFGSTIVVLYCAVLLFLDARVNVGYWAIFKKLLVR